MTPDLRREFEQAADDIRQQMGRLDDATALKLYALYKQGSQGDACGVSPGFADFVGTARHEAWVDLLGLDPQEARRRYVALVTQLLALLPPATPIRT